MSNEQSPAPLGEFESLVLAAVLQLGERAYGVAVRREIEGNTGREVSMGALYTTLARLEKKKLLTTTMGDPTPSRGGRAKKYFRVEPAGVQALEQMVRNINRITKGLFTT